MNSKEILIIALRIGAVIIVVNTLEKFPSSYAIYLSDDSITKNGFVLFSVLPSAFVLLISGLMWIYPDVLLNNPFLREKGIKNDDLKSPELGSLLISIVGLYVLTFSIADMIYHIAFIKEAKMQLGSTFELMPENKAQIIATIAELIMGFVLLFGSNFISLILYRLQKEIKGNSL